MCEEGFKCALIRKKRRLPSLLMASFNQRSNGHVNAHLISEPIQNLDKIAEKTLTLIRTNNPQLTHSFYNINLIPGHRMQ